MSKYLYENFKDDFRLGAAISGIILMSDEEREQLFQFMKKRMEEFKKNFKPQPGMPEFKFPEPQPYPKGDMPDKKLAAQHFNLVVAENECKMGSIYHGPDQFDFSGADRLLKFARENGQAMR